MYDIPNINKINYIIINNIKNFSINEVHFVALCKIYNKDIEFSRRMDITKSDNGVFVLTEDIIKDSYKFIKKFWNENFDFILYELRDRNIIDVPCMTIDIREKYKNALNNKFFDNKDVIFSLTTIYSLYINNKNNDVSFLKYNDEEFRDCIDIAMDIIYKILEMV